MFLAHLFEKLRTLQAKVDNTEEAATRSNSSPAATVEELPKVDVEELGSGSSHALEAGQLLKLDVKEPAPDIQLHNNDEAGGNDANDEAEAAEASVEVLSNCTAAAKKRKRREVSPNEDALGENFQMGVATRSQRLAFSPNALKKDDMKTDSRTSDVCGTPERFIVVEDDKDEQPQDESMPYRERKPVGKSYYRPDGMSEHRKQLLQTRKEAEAQARSRKPRVHFTTSDVQVTFEHWQSCLNSSGFQPHQKIICKQIIDDAMLLKYFDIDNSNFYSYRSNMPERLRQDLSSLHELIFGCRVSSHTKLKTKFCRLFLMHYELKKPVNWASFAQSVHIQNRKSEKTTQKRKKKLVDMDLSNHELPDTNPEDTAPTVSETGTHCKVHSENLATSDVSCLQPGSITYTNWKEDLKQAIQLLNSVYNRLP